MPNFHFQTDSYKNHPTSNGLGWAELNNAAVTTMKLSRLFLLVAIVVLSSVFLSGCGQKGELYLTEDAPSNTNFILYKGNKVEGSNTVNNQAEQAENQQKIEEAAATDPQDY